MRPAACVALVALVASVEAHAAGAIAVMPWKNLSADASLDWLRLGMAETLVADLTRDGSRKVVERAALDAALAELALQASPLIDDSTAARAGKLVGASTVVLGGFQATGTGKDKALRLTARFVDVESGVVTDTAKIDGVISDVFSLQDQLVARLLKKPPRKARPKAKAPERRVEAFRVYSLSLSTSSQADQVKYLKESVALDPDFVYAADDLLALEYRLRQFRKRAAKIEDEAARAMLASLDDSSRPEQERAMDAMRAFGTFAVAFRWYALRDVAATMLEKEKLPQGSVDLRELASYNYVFALAMLKDTDLALQAGERHLERWPAGIYARSVTDHLQNIIGERQRRADAQAKIPDELAAIAADEDELLAQHAQGPLPNLDERLKVFAFRRCSVVYQHRDFDDAVRRCLRFADDHPQDEPQHLARSARYFAAIAHSEQGRFDEARTIMMQLTDEDAVWARSMAVPSFLTMWPAR